MWMILDYRQILEIKGTDRVSFLQGLVTQDIRNLSPEKPLYGLFLTNTGRFFCDFFIVTQGTSIFLTPGAECLESLQKKLSFYKLRSDVSISHKTDWLVAVSLKEEPLLPKEGIVFQDPRLFDLGSVFLGPLDALEDVTSNKESYESCRLKFGIPEGPLDLEIGKSIPLENWMDELNAIGWEKGCFLGQELTSRTKHVGEIRKKILSFSAEAPLSRGDLLSYPQGYEIGKIMSTYQKGKKGFCLVHIKDLPEDEKVFSENSTIVTLYKPRWEREA